MFSPTSSGNFLASREPADTQHLRGYERQRCADETQQNAHADLRTQLSRRQQRGTQKQADTEPDGGAESNDDQLPHADVLRQVKAGRNSNAGPDEYPQRLPGNYRNRQPPRSGFQRSKRNAGVHQSEEKQRHLRRMPPPNLESVQRIGGIRGRVDKKPRVAFRVRQKGHDRNQSKRGIESTQE